MLCSYCGKSLDEGKSACKECQDKHLEEQHSEALLAKELKVKRLPLHIAAIVLPLILVFLSILLLIYRDRINVAIVETKVIATKPFYGDEYTYLIKDKMTFKGRLLSTKDDNVSRKNYGNALVLDVAEEPAFNELLKIKGACDRIGNYPNY
ncbi:MAG: hypothetical protein GYA55_04580 [SAR324 cluster bacterium]|uniref:Uncharacterized protein n=1 Tax=SAR324 cluster bacterium TaxID=2024889 RepID=A0A7X9FRE9_9DELT|nr:hypothetical protein [SAR324 cluster bacterium]